MRLSEKCVLSNGVRTLRLISSRLPVIVTYVEYQQPSVELIQWDALFHPVRMYRLQSYTVDILNLHKGK